MSASLYDTIARATAAEAALVVALAEAKAAGVGQAYCYDALCGAYGSATPDEAQMVRDEFGNDEIEVDEPALVSRMRDEETSGAPDLGVWVHAWLFLRNPELAA